MEADREKGKKMSNIRVGQMCMCRCLCMCVLSPFVIDVWFWPAVSPWGQQVDWCPCQHESLGKLVSLSLGTALQMEADGGRWREWKIKRAKFKWGTTV